MRQTVFLNNDIEMPLLGFGVFGLTEDSSAYQSVLTALESGYRLIDTASAYKNEPAVGRAIARSGIARKDLFVTSKVWNTAQRLGDIEGAFSRSLDRLKLDYVDLYLIHWPVPGCYPGTWKALEKILDSGRTRAIGVSNFDIRHLEELKSISGIVPAVNQIENHPFWYRKELITYCEDHGIQVQAYCPLARKALLDHDVLCVLATKYVKTTAQIALRWGIQKGISVIPRSSQAAHIKSNADIFDFEIAEEDMAILDTLNQNLRTANIPEDLREIPF